MHCCRRSCQLQRCLLTIHHTEIVSSSRYTLSTVPSSTYKENDVLSQASMLKSRTEVMAFRNKMFDETRRKQLNKLVPRNEKIEVQYQGRGISDNALMFMNKHISTPYHCALHVSKTVADHAVLSLVTPLDQETSSVPQIAQPSGKELATINDATPVEPKPIVWDIHRPLPFNCKVEILKFSMANTTPWHHEVVNKAYWLSCAMVLGAVIQEAFKEEHTIGLYRLPHISVNRGAFCYDVITDVSLKGWKPQERDLIFLTKVARSIVSQDLKFERLEVETETAEKIFTNDPCQLTRISEIVEKNGKETKICLYRFGEHIDVSNGPHISNTSQIYHYVVTAINKLQNETNFGQDLWRVQGLSLPENLKVHHAVWSMLENRARKLVKENLHRADAVDVKQDRTDWMSDSIENATKEYMQSTGQWREGTWKKTTDTLKPTLHS